MKTKHQKLFSTAAVILIAFGLRAYQLGHDSFWNDEAGQALAAIQPTVRDSLAIARSHVMAMPLDYLVSYVTSRVGVQETIMRFPALVFGTLTLALHFALTRRITRFEVALTATWLLGLYAVHIAYSQEMRFYSSLCLFYALSNLLLFRALHRSSTRNWILFVLATSLGVYFHPYVLLVPVNGFLYLLIKSSSSRFRDRSHLLAGVPLLVSTTVLGLVFLPGYLYFGADQQLNYDLLQWTGSLFKVVVRGLGWLSYSYAEMASRFGIWELTGVVFAIVGFVTLVKHHRRYQYLLSVVVGACIQIVLIILADSMRGYWFAPRQLVHLTPTVLALTGLGVVGTLECLARASRKLLPSEGRVPSLLVVVSMVAIGLIALPRMSEYYAYPKSNGEQLAVELQRVYQEGGPVYVIPGYEEKVYRFYLLTEGSPRSVDVIQALRPVSWEDLQLALLAEDPGEMYVILPAITTTGREHLESLKGQGFAVLVEPEVNWNHARFLLARE